MLLAIALLAALRQDERQGDRRNAGIAIVERQRLTEQHLPFRRLPARNPEQPKEARYIGS